MEFIFTVNIELSIDYYRKGISRNKKPFITNVCSIVYFTLDKKSEIKTSILTTGKTNFCRTKLACET